MEGRVTAVVDASLILVGLLDAAFWTADRRLAARARESGADWVECLLDGK